MNFKKIVLFSVVLFIIMISVLLVYMYSSSDATDYCPLSHKFNPDMYCRVCDRLNERILIEHFNRDTNELSLSIFENGKMIWIQHPKEKLTNYNSSIEKNTILFERNNSSNLVVNGSIFPIIFLE